MTITQEARNAMILPCRGAESLDLAAKCDAPKGGEWDVVWFEAAGDIYCHSCGRTVEVSGTPVRALVTEANRQAAELNIGRN